VATARNYARDQSVNGQKLIGSDYLRISLLAGTGLAKAPEMNAEAKMRVVASLLSMMNT
jgi:hypothetical protein